LNSSIRNIIDFILILIIIFLCFIVNLPYNAFSLYILSWNLTGIHFVTSTINIFILIYLIYINNKKFCEGNFYKYPLIILLIGALSLFTIFLFKIFSISEKYLFYFTFINIDSSNNILTGIGIGISALLAVFSMLYQIESNKIEKELERIANFNLQKKALINIIMKIINLIDFEIKSLNRKKDRIISKGKGDKIILPDKKASFYIYSIIQKDFDRISNYYEMIDSFKHLNNAEKSIVSFKGELEENESQINFLIDSLNAIKKNLLLILSKNIRDELL